MVAKVMIDRKIKEGKESDFFKLLKELRAKAIAARGTSLAKHFKP